MKVKKVEFRIAQKSDAKETGDLEVSAFLAAYANMGPEFTISLAREKDLRDFEKWSANGTVLVAVESEKIAASVVLLPYGSPVSGSWFPDYWELRMLASRPDLQGTGVGKLLENYAARFAKEGGAKGFCIRVRDGLPGLLRFYENLGYTPDKQGDQVHTDPLIQLYGKSRKFL